MNGTLTEEQLDRLTKLLYTPRYVDIIANIILLLIGAPANVKVLFLLLKDKLYSRSRHHYLLLNLALADCIVMLIMVPGEILKLSLITWRSNDFMCRSFQFIRVFGLYESSFVIVCISIDRYFAVVKPFTYQFMDQRIKMMINLSWAVSFLVSLPQVGELYALFFHTPTQGPINIFYTILRIKFL